MEIREELKIHSWGNPIFRSLSEEKGAANKKKARTCSFTEAKTECIRNAGLLNQHIFSQTKYIIINKRTFFSI